MFGKYFKKKKEYKKNLQKKTQLCFTSCQRYQDSRHILQFLKGSKNVITYINYDQIHNPPKYLS